MKHFEVIIKCKLEENHEVYFTTPRHNIEPSQLDHLCTALDESFKEVENIEHKIHRFDAERREFGIDEPITIDSIKIRVGREDDTVVGEVDINDKQELVLLPKLYELFIAE